MQSENDGDDFPKVTLTAPDGAQAEINLYGAHVTSWRPADGEEQLFLSERAEFTTGKAIRGGVPVCFPQFADEGPFLKHGFARLNLWQLVSTRQEGDSAQAILQLEDSIATQALWPHAFLATLTVTVSGPNLRLEFRVKNTGHTPFDFTGALHTYLRVHDIETTVVENLAGCHYRDSVTGVKDNVQTDPEVCFTGEVDRIYIQAPAQVLVREPGRSMIVQATGFPDVVVWNPGPEKCAALQDMHPEGYRSMVCIEAAVVDKPPEILPGESWYGSQELRTE